MKLVAATCLTCLGAAVAGAAGADLGAVVVESRLAANFSSILGSVLGGWQVGPRARGEELLTLHLFLAHSPHQRAALERCLLASSEPTGPGYGRHLTFQELNDLLRPPADAVLAVRSWLAGAGVDWGTQVAHNPGQDILEVTLPVRDVEHLLAAEYHTLTHVSDGAPILRTGRYSLPAAVASYIDIVGPTIRLPSRPQKKTRLSPADTAYTTPVSLREQYGATGFTASSKNNGFALCGFLDQYFAKDDVDYFFQTFDQQSVGKTISVKGPNPGPSGMEATVDVCYGAAMAAGVATTFWSTAGRMPGHSDNEPLLQWLADVASDPAPPLVFSFSYSDNEDTVDAQYAQRVNVELQKAGARGLSIIESSGDGGVAGIQPESYCPGGFMATFPATSPYVTSVGSTGGPAGAETASTHFPSGGGFSTYSWQPRPDFQKAAVEKYLQSGATLPSSSLYNSSTRGYPDVSLNGENYALTQYSISINVDGTSCSAPSFGAMVAMLNDVRLSKGLPSLGWLNPLLYAHPEAFTDITQGSNPACGNGGFPAAPGWDPVTGLGTMKFKAWEAIVQQLPAAEAAELLV